jgi:hypothetical protein
MVARQELLPVTVIVAIVQLCGNSKRRTKRFVPPTVHLTRPPALVSPSACVEPPCRDKLPERISARSATFLAPDKTALMVC